MKNAIFLTISLLMLAGCGSGSTVTLPQPKKATLVFSLSTSASLPTAVKAISISARIPAGATVPIEPGTNKQVAASALLAFKAGSIMGSYSSQVLRIDVYGDPNSSTGLGVDNVRQFAGIMLPVEANVTEGSFTALNPSFPFSASGFTSGNTVDLTPKLKSSMKVTF